MNDKVTGLKLALEHPDQPLDHDAVRQAIQGIVMDEIDLDSASPVRVRVPDTLVRRLGDLLDPWLGRAHGEALLERFELVFGRLSKVTDAAAAETSCIVYVTLQKGGILIGVKRAEGEQCFQASEFIAWHQVGDAETCPLDAALKKLIATT